jgi:uncharacterized protein
LCVAANDTASAEPGKRGRPFLALILPVDSADFGGPAKAVAAGCRAALETADAPRLPMQLGRTDGDTANVISAYLRAIERGAAVVVGPMTRDAVTALARQAAPSVPTVALNVPESNAALPPRFYSFGLSAEAEARLAARRGAATGLKHAVIVQARSALARRVSQAFAEEWLASGGSIAGLEEVNHDTHLPALRQQLVRSRTELVFLSAEAADARFIRPYLPRHLPVYATSLVHTGRADPVADADLEGIRLFEMPWLVQRDHPAVMVYARPEGLEDGFQRFYALGIDACRVALLLAGGQESIDLDGVTGHIRLRPGGRLEREPLAVVFRGGEVVREGR